MLGNVFAVILAYFLSSFEQYRRRNSTFFLGQIWPWLGPRRTVIWGKWPNLSQIFLRALKTRFFRGHPWKFTENTCLKRVSPSSKEHFPLLFVKIWLILPDLWHFFNFFWKYKIFQKIGEICPIFAWVLLKMTQFWPKNGPPPGENTHMSTTPVSWL